MINFDEGNLAAGTLVTDQFEGINVSTPSEFGVMVFDTNNPTGEDYDLSAEDLGNVLIISEDGDTSDPDDNAVGGTIKIEIDLGNGNDYVYGAVEVIGEGDNNVGIYNDFSSGIDLGAGNDRIVGVGGDAYTGFSADLDDYGFIDLGEGNDRITGFGANQQIDGGSGTDVAEFEFIQDDSVTFGSSDSNAIDITANEKTMSFTNVEEFVFADESFSLDELISLS